jgi:uncharacterized protein with HEPN domain
LRSRDPRQSLLDIVENIGLIEGYTAGMDQAAFSADRRTRDAVERCLQRVSEAAVRLGDRASQLAPDLPWRKIRGIGNHLRHGYDVVEPEIIWNIVERDLLPLRAGCEAALARLPPPD